MFSNSRKICLKWINAREICLFELEKKTKELKISEEKTDDNKNNIKIFFDLIQEYRLLTQNSIEYILRWREYMAYPFLVHLKTDNRKIKNFITLPFFYNEQNYILKVAIIAMIYTLFFLFFIDEKRLLIFERLFFKKLL